MNTLKKLWSWIAHLPRRYSIGGAIVLIAVIVVGIHFAIRPAATPTVPPTVPHVSVATIAALTSGTSPLSLVGNVTSLNQATILSQASGQLVSLNVAIGDQVGAGETIGQFDATSQNAALLQAQGAYQQALASQSSLSPVDAKTAATNAYVNAYGALNTALTVQVDMSFGSSTPYGPQFLLNAPTQPYGSISQERQALTYEMLAYQQATVNGTTTDPITLLTEASSVAQDILNLINQISSIAIAANSGATAGQISAINTAHASVTGVISTLATAIQTYRSQSVSTTAGTNANVTEALGGLQVAQANVAKTVVTSPISGTIVSLPVSQGDFVSLGATVAVVSNPNALEIDTYVTPDDAKTIGVGAVATIDNNATGTVLSIAPALDPTTNKILVKIGLTNGGDTITDGDTVSVSIAQTATAATSTASGPIVIPIEAVQVTPTGDVVFTVTPSSTLATVPVTLGTIFGGSVTILSGVTPDMDVVTDTRGLSEGEAVVVNND